ncbi:hypothetical protein JZ751_026976 [Albula glossodonta]|uniref:Uncharacterized protein n=1 Tax=Albula glossodonta TaxID=121402 RepID=A0A8T2NCQ2_9TELE|nr:hypothetical protein JZ751_026976 [Albula glossodonta]
MEDLALMVHLVHLEPKANLKIAKLHKHYEVNVAPLDYLGLQVPLEIGVVRVLLDLAPRDLQERRAFRVLLEDQDHQGHQVRKVIQVRHRYTKVPLDLQELQENQALQALQVPPDSMGHQEQKGILESQALGYQVLQEKKDSLGLLACPERLVALAAQVEMGSLGHLVHRERRESLGMGHQVLKVLREYLVVKVSPGPREMLDSLAPLEVQAGMDLMAVQEPKVMQVFLGCQELVGPQVLLP